MTTTDPADRPQAPRTVLEFLENVVKAAATDLQRSGIRMIPDEPVSTEIVTTAFASRPGITVLPVILPGEEVDIRRPRIYLSGPMTGLPDWNHPAFDAAAARWSEQGWLVINPADACHREPGLPRREYMRWDLGHLLAADAICLLDGWSGSIGARLEMRIAAELGLLVLEDGTEKDHRVCEMPLSRRPWPEGA